MDAKTHFKIAGDFHKAASAEHAGLAEECAGEGYEKMAARHTNLAKLHSDNASHCEKACADATRKAADDEMAKLRSASLEPPVISRVTPTAPGVVAVPRAGQKPVEKSNVDPEFAFLAKGDSRDEE